MTSGWQGVNKRAPCLACGRIDRCATRVDDEGAEWIHCFRSKDPPHGWKFAKDSPNDSRGALFVRGDRENGRGDGNRNKPRQRTAPPRAPLDLVAEHARFRQQLTLERRDELARVLSVPTFALEALEVGYATADDLKQLRAGFTGEGERPSEAWTFPERSGAGVIVGFSLRARDGRKGAPSSKVGARRGLIVPSNLDAVRGGVFVVEGASDVAAMLALGRCVVGRPSNSSGSGDLAQLLRERAPDVFVLGENDERQKDGRTLWPGRSGALKIACDLAQAWRTGVRWALPPDGAKDLRAWLQARVAAGLDLGNRGARDAAGRELLAALERSAETIEPPPEPARLDWRPFPTDALPEPLRSWVREAATAINVDEAALAILKLATTAALVGNARRLRLTGSWAAPSILWASVLMPSGEKKSAIVRAAGRTLNAIDMRDREASGKAREEWEVDKAGQCPRERLRVLRDCSVEAAINRSRDNPRGLAYASAELAGLFKSLNQYRAGGKGNDRERLLAMYDGDENSRDLVSSSIFVRRCSLSVFGASTEAPFIRSLGKEGEEDGALARFLVAMPPEPEPLTFAELRAARQPDNAAVEEIEGKLAALELGADGAPVDIDLSASGLDRWAVFYDAFQARRISLPTGPLRSHFAKLEEACARIALGFHFWRVLAGDVALEAVDRIDGRTIDAAARVTLWLADEAERVYSILLDGLTPESPQERARRRIMETLERRGPLSKRDAKNSAREFRRMSDEDFERMLRELVQSGELTSETVTDGGRPSERFQVSEDWKRKRKDQNSEESEACASASTASDREDAPTKQVPESAADLSEATWERLEAHVREFEAAARTQRDARKLAWRHEYGSTATPPDWWSGDWGNGGARGH